MQRRTLLALAGASIPAAFAGCLESDEGDRDTGSPDDDGSGDGSGGGDGGDGGSSGDGGSDDPVTILDHEWYNDGAYSSGVTGQVENVSGETLSYVGVNVYFLDADGVQFAEGLDNTTDLAADRVWEFDAMFTGDDPQRVENYEIEWDVSNY